MKKILKCLPYDRKDHCVKIVRIRSISGRYFPAFRMNTDRYSICPYSVQIRENTDQKNSEYGHFLPSGHYDY